MARIYDRLKDLDLKRTEAGERVHDGGGLYFNATHLGRGSWSFRFRFNGRNHMMGLGPYPEVSLAEARELRGDASRKLRQGNNPLRDREREPVGETKPFRTWAEEYIAASKQYWTAKQALRWRTSLERYAHPVIGEKPFDAITVPMIREILDPIWSAKTETASQLRGRIAKVWNFASVQTGCEKVNPATWTGRLDVIYPSPKRIHKVQPYASLAYERLQEFFPELCQRREVGSLGLQFTILTGARTIMSRFAVWDEFDLPNRLWIIPRQRVPKKIDKEFRVPLSDEAIAILDRLAKFRRDNWLLPGQKKGRPITDVTMTRVLTRMGRDDITVHGFRSTLRTWGAEVGNFRQDIVEMALAHTTNAAKLSGVGVDLWLTYQRGELLEKPRYLMTEWAKFATASNVVPIRVAAE